MDSEPDSNIGSKKKLNVHVEEEKIEEEIITPH